MKKEKRKPRKKLSKITDPLYPINISEFGSAKDPCFGKLYDPRASECSRCGDSEICSIAMQQLVKFKRQEQETQQDFKDLEEAEKPPIDPKIIRKAVKSRIRELVKLSGKKGITAEELISDVHAIYAKRGYTRKKITTLIQRMVELKKNIFHTKDTDVYLWKA